MPVNISHPDSLIPSDICACFLELIVPTVSHAGVDDMAGSDTLRLVDDQTFEMLDRYSLEPMELGISASSMSFVEDDSTYYVIGTAFTEPDEAESKKVSYTHKSARLRYHIHIARYSMLHR